MPVEIAFQAATLSTNPFLSLSSALEIFDLQALVMQRALQIQALTKQLQALSLSIPHIKATDNCIDLVDSSEAQVPPATRMKSVGTIGSFGQRHRNA